MPDYKDNGRNNRRGGRLRLEVAAAVMAGLALAGCTTEAKPAQPTTSQLPPDPEKPSANGEDWASREALADKYADAASAAEYLMGGSDGNGLYSEILNKAGQRGEKPDDNTGKINAPHEAIVALFGEEPANGYPENVQRTITQLNEYYDRFAFAYKKTIDMGTPVTCTTTFTDVQATSGNTVEGTVSQKCENTGGLIGNKNGDWDWTAGLKLTVNQQTNADGKKVWVITDATDIGA